MKKIICLIIICQLFFGCAGQQKVLKKETVDLKIIAVLPFENSTGIKKYEPLESLIMEIITTNLVGLKDIKIAERQRLIEVLKEQKLQLTGITDQESRVKIAKILGANLILFGGFTSNNLDIKVNAHLFEVETTKLIKSEEIDGKVTDILDLVKNLSDRIIKGFNVEKQTIKTNEIDNRPDISFHYIRGLQYYYGCMYDHAIIEFINILEMDPSNTDALFWKAESYYEEKEYGHAKIDYEAILNLFPNYRNIQIIQKRLEVCNNEKAK
ncbi:MAG: CsgG/HfaB family protein [Candidatus Firestonebacteria bacterium]